MTQELNAIGLQKGDRVRFRNESSMRLDYKIPAGEIGTIVEVEPFPPQTGPTYKVRAEFPSCSRLLPFVFWPEYVRVDPTDI